MGSTVRVALGRWRFIDACRVHSSPPPAVADAEEPPHLCLWPGAPVTAETATEAGTSPTASPSFGSGRAPVLVAWTFRRPLQSWLAGSEAVRWSRRPICGASRHAVPGLDQADLAVWVSRAPETTYPGTEMVLQYSVKDHPSLTSTAPLCQ